MLFVIIIAALILLALFCIYVYKESTEYHIVRYAFSDSRLKKDKTSFVFLSDLHNMQYGNKNCRLYDDIVKLDPDFIVIGGDMITSCMEKWTDYSDTLEFIERLAKFKPVYYSIGNHEERLKRCPDKFPEGEFERLTGKLEKINTPLMIDESLLLDDYGIKLFLLNIDHLYYRKVVTRKLPEDYIYSKIGEPDSSYYNILAVHNPEHFKSYAMWGADLTLSGHVHGGIIRIPGLGGVISPALKIFPKYDGGEFAIGNSRMVLSRGIGTHTVPIRINNKAELILIELEKK